MAAQTSSELMALSGSVNGRGIKIAATATPGTLLHTGVTGTASIDMVSLKFVNSDTTARKVTVEWGGVTSPDDTIEFTVPPEGGLVELPPMPINNALVIRAFCATTNVVIVLGDCVRFS